MALRLRLGERFEVKEKEATEETEIVFWVSVISGHTSNGWRF